MLLEDLVKKQQEKPPIDWDVYLKWRMKAEGGIPIVWVCHCAQINTARLPLGSYLKCSGCGVLHPVRVRD